MSVALLGAPQPWPPPPSPSPPLPPTLPSYDCSISVCTIFCPQHCNILTPPITDSSSPSSRLSPLMVALITLLVSAFLLLCYYTVISKYCKRRREDIRRRRDRDQIERLELESRLDQLIYDSTTHTTTNATNRNTNSVPNSSNGLDERMIKAITVFKYRRGEGIIEGTDCAVCLSEFRDSESLRLMPNCQHAFHVDCIDTWLKSQSNCPICRSGMIYQVPPARVAAAAAATEVRTAATEVRTAATEVRTAAMRVDGREGVVVVVVSGGEQRCEIEIGEVNCGGER